MIDVENQIFTKIKNSIIAQFPNTFVTGEEVRIPSQYPCVSVVEADNYIYRSASDNNSVENAVVLMYEINAYSNKSNGKKSEAKALIAVVDEAMNSLGLSRQSLNPTTINEGTAIRMIARYSGVVSKDEKIYRR